MTAHTATVAFDGLQVKDIDVQVHIAPGMPCFTVVGLPDKAVGESRERIRSALASIGVALPPSRITVNLAPADLLKEGSHYDLPILCGIMAELNVLPAETLQEYIIMGELSLDGGICRVCGALPAAIHAQSREMGLICPAGNGSEAALSGNKGVIAPAHLLALTGHLKETQLLPPIAPPDRNAARASAGSLPDLSDVKGQESAKRALEIAAAGGHNMLMCGPPGSGKSMLAARLPGILPPPEPREILETGMIASITGAAAEARDLGKRPFRDPHHSCSTAAMVGGGRRARPGEVTMAHNGVLFLDELPEFPRNVLDALRQPLETGNVTVSRAENHVTYPASFQLIAAMNPCRCGYLGDPERACRKAPVCGAEYGGRISGPMYDRIDIHVEVAEVSPAELNRTRREGESSATVLERVLAARERQKERFKNETYLVNARANGDALETGMRLGGEARTVLEQAYAKLRLSMRGYYRVLRTARTIADLDSADDILKKHVLEALYYRKATHVTR